MQLIYVPGWQSLGNIYLFTTFEFPVQQNAFYDFLWEATRAIQGWKTNVLTKISWNNVKQWQRVNISNDGDDYDDWYDKSGDLDDKRSPWSVWSKTNKLSSSLSALDWKRCDLLFDLPTKSELVHQEPRLDVVSGRDCIKYFIVKTFVRWSHTWSKGCNTTPLLRDFYIYHHINLKCQKARVWHFQNPIY